MTIEADRKGAILRAAIEVFSKKGYHGCRIADVAREAGVAYGLVYHYYQDKETLLQSVFEYAWNGLVGRFTERALQAKTVQDQVRGIVAVAFETYKTDPRAVKVLILEVARGQSGKKSAATKGSAFSGVMELAAAMFRDGQSRGELDPSLDPVICATMLFGTIEAGLTAFIVGLLDRKPETIDRASAQIAESFINGISGQGTFKVRPFAERPRAAKGA